MELGYPCNNLRQVAFAAHGKMLLYVLMALFCGVLFIWAATTGWTNVWKQYGIFLPERFGGDFNGILLRCMCLIKNGQPYGEVQSCMMNYPWITLHIVNALGINQEDVANVTIVMGIFFYLIAMAIFRKMMVYEGVVVFLFLISPPAVFGFQRGNIDELMFILVAGACLLASSAKVYGRVWLASLFVLAAACLKLYPITALFAFAVEANTRKKRLAVWTSGILFGLYCLWNLGQLMLIFEKNYPIFHRGYGVNILPELLLDKTPYRAILAENRLQVKLFFLALIGACGYLVSRKYKGIVPRVNSYSLRCFRTGYITYLSTYLVLGMNYDYRLIFLGLCLPQLFLWIRSPSKAVQWYGMGILALIMLTCWTSYLSARIYYFNHYVNIVLAIAFMHRFLVDMRLLLEATRVRNHLFGRLRSGQP